MKLRGKHIALGIVVLLVGAFALVLAAGLRSPDDEGRRVAGATEDDFLESVRREAERRARTGAGTLAETGTLPPAGVDARPDIEVETTRYDMGEIVNNDLTRGRVMIYNRGDYDLEIMQVNTTCACTEGRVERKTIPPGGQEPMIVTLNPARIPGFDSHKVLTIVSNDPDEPQVNVDVLARVKPEFTVEPRPVEFGQVPKGDVVLQQVVVRQADDNLMTREDKPFTVEKAQSTAPGLRVSVSERPESEWAQPNRREYAVELILDTNQVPPGDYHANFSFETNVHRVMHYRNDVSATVVAPYSVTPRPLSLGAVQPGQQDAALLTLTGTGPVAVGDLATTAPDLLVSLRATEPERGLIAVSVAPDAGLGFKRGEVKFTVTIGDRTYTESIPVTASVVRETVAPAATQTPSRVEPGEPAGDSPLPQEG